MHTSWKKSKYNHKLPAVHDGWGYAMAQLRYSATSRKVADSIPKWRRWNFSLIKFFRPHSGAEVDSASIRNEYQEHLLKAKAAGAYDWQPYHLHVQSFLKYGRLNLLETSGPVQACNGITLPLLLPLHDSSKIKMYKRTVHKKVSLHFPTPLRFPFLLYKV